MVVLLLQKSKMSRSVVIVFDEHTRGRIVFVDDGRYDESYRFPKYIICRNNFNVRKFYLRHKQLKNISTYLYQKYWILNKYILININI